MLLNKIHTSNHLIYQQTTNNMYADLAYLELLQDIIDNGQVTEDRTGTGTMSVFGRQIKYDLKRGFPLLTTKQMGMKNITTELLWFLRGETNIRPLVDVNNLIWVGDAYKNYCKQSQLKIDTGRLQPDDLLLEHEFVHFIKTSPDFASEWGELGPIYGEKWRNFNEVDQIVNAINTLKTNPTSRRIIVSAWDPSEIHLAILPPCHIMFQFGTRLLETPVMNKLGILANRALSCSVYIRSNDMPLGHPYNVASYALLTEIIAAECDMIADELTISIGDCHIYLNQVELCKEQISREPFPMPQLRFSDQIQFGKGLQGILDTITHKDVIIDDYYSHPAINYPLSN